MIHSELKDIIQQEENQSELMRLFQASGIFHYDANGVEKTGISDFNFTELDRYFSEYHIHFSKQ